MRAWLMVMMLGLAGWAFAQNAQVRVAHLSPDAPEVDIWVNGTKVEALTKVAFKSVSPYLSLPAAEHTVWVVPTSKTEPKVIDAKVKVEANKVYTIAVVGLLKDIKAAVLTDNLTTPAAGKAHVRVLHTVPNFPGVDIRVKDGQGTLLFQNLTFGNAAEYKPVDAGTYDLAVFATGDTSRGIPAAGIKLEAGNSYTVIAAGQYRPGASGSLVFLLITDK